MLEPALIVKHFANDPTNHEYDPGTVIFSAGETGEQMFAVLEGEVELQVNGQTVETISAGDVFGEGALVQDPPLRATIAVTKTRCKLAAINRERFLFLVQETPMFALQLLRSFSTRLRILTESLRA